ncbi:unnamed protein product [Candidula unifasciata]|uniref:Heparanase n=1 Tax=Candidula unifasciata TaxID=100452 RepID=A0A8S3Z817_9EUPU|nr:unnamed protein product [Candidula unifasciata]
MAWLRFSIILLLNMCVLIAHSSPIEADAPLTMQVARSAADATYAVTVNLTSSQHSCDVRFLSVAIGSRRITLDWNGSEKLLNLASALSPADLRLGGTSANFLHFDPTERPGTRDRFYTSSHKTPFTVTARQWDLFVSFLRKAGLDLLFNVNNLMWTKDGSWDPSNADKLLNYSSAKGVQIPYFQLGNEPSSYQRNFYINRSPQKLVQDYRTLKNLLAKYPLYAGSKLNGPDVANVATSYKARVYLQEFVAAGANDIVDELSIHHYYMDSRKARMEDFISPTWMNYLKHDLAHAQTISRSSPRPKPVTLTETASCSNGGASGLSDRYIAGFLWLDKLGLAAQSGVTRVFRQTFLGGYYALISNRHDPHPDFYLSVLYKQLIEGPVFNLNISPPNPQLRVYAHCARTLLYLPGAIVVYYLNLEKSQTVLSLSQFQANDLHLYQLTPGDTSGLTSKYVKLNGQTLMMSGTKLPTLLPRLQTGDVTLEALSFGFIVVPHANVSLCVEYFQRDP